MGAPANLEALEEIVMTVRSMLCSLLGAVALALSPLPLAGEVIPADRLLDWDPGVRGGVPTYYFQASVADYGAVGDGIADDGPAFNAAIDAVATSGEVGFVWVPPGDYRIATIVQMKSGVALQGAGPDRTRLLFELPGFGFRGGIEFTGSIHAEETSVLSGHTLRSREITLASAEGIVPGTTLWLYQDDDDALMYTVDYWRTDYSPQSMSQLVGVESVDGNTLQLDVELRLDYSAALNPRVRIIEPITDAGVEGLYLERLDTANAYTISMDYAENCWVRHVESRLSYRSHIWAFYSRFLSIENSYFHEAHDYGGGGHGYGVTLGDSTSDSLVSNNIFHTLRHSTMVKEGASGNVFGYNYSFDNQSSGADGSLHGHYNHGNLFEGNAFREIVVADWWGPSGPYTTLFRNRTSSFVGISVRDHSHFANVVGNTASTIDIRTGGDIVIFGYPVYMGGVRDQLVDGNLVGGQLEWSGPGALELPESHYLDGPPTFWDARPWPAIGADVDEINSPDLEIPAQTRYDEILAGTWTAPIPIILSQSDAVAGESLTLSVINARAGETVRFAASQTGLGGAPCPIVLGGLCGDLADPIRYLGATTADENGVAERTVTLPIDLEGLPLATQAFVARGVDGVSSVKTNAVEATVTAPR